MKPCKQCPFRRDSIAGYLGELSHKPEEFLHRHPNAMPCHLSVEGNADVKSGVKEIQCIGMLQFFNNQFKISKIQDIAQLQNKAGKNKEVFQWSTEFIKHHSK